MDCGLSAYALTVCDSIAKPAVYRLDSEFHEVCIVWRFLYTPDSVYAPGLHASPLAEQLRNGVLSLIYAATAAAFTACAII